MKRTAGVIAGLMVLAGLASAWAAEDFVSGGAIRDRIRDRMEKKRLDRVPQISSAIRLPGAGPGYESILIKGQTRTFIRYTPNSVLVSGKRAPVVFALHGERGTASQVQGYLGLNAVADRERFVVVYPQGEGNLWNDGRIGDLGASDPVSTAEDVAFLNGLADALVVQGVADAGRIFILGLSNGGGMALALACNGESRFAGFGSVVAGMPQAAIAKCKPKRPTPVVMINGTQDEVVSLGGGATAAPLEVARHFAGLAGCKRDDEVALPHTDASDGTRVALRTFTACEPGRAVAFYTVTGGGHQAPAMGAAATGGSLEMMSGLRSHDLDTAEAVWAFFKSLQR